MTETQDESPVPDYLPVCSFHTFFHPVRFTDVIPHAISTVYQQQNDATKVYLTFTNANLYSEIHPFEPIFFNFKPLFVYKILIPLVCLSSL